MGVQATYNIEDGIVDLHTMLNFATVNFAPHLTQGGDCGVILNGPWEAVISREVDEGWYETGAPILV